MKLIAIFCIIVLTIIILYGLFYPKNYTIYKDKDGNMVLVTNISGMVVTLQYVTYDEHDEKCSAITGPQNWDLFEFIKTFRLWRML